jgi:VanZ family protein
MCGGEVTRGRLYFGMLAGWVALTFTLTSIPNPEFVPLFSGSDKIAHFAFYGIMGFLYVLWRREVGTGAAAAVLGAAIFAAFLGAVDEFHQQWIPGRSMELLDWATDFAGGTAGGVCSAVAASMLPFLLTRKPPSFSRAFKD